ncbi:MAG: sulfotransferase family protein [Bacteroidota bacterium]
MIEENISSKIFHEHPVFICGAPRSGTTLLMNLLDGHHNLLVFPHEVNIIYYYYKFKNDINKLFFIRDYLYSNELSLYLDPDFQKKINKKKIYTYGNPDSLISLNKKKFINTYLKSINIFGSGLKGLYISLANAFASSSLDSDSINKLSRFVAKRPIYNEIYAPLFKKVFPQALFIHILRDPRTRYASAKNRRLQDKFKMKYCNDVNGRDFASGLSEISALSFDLAIRNKELIGGNYLVIRYEDLIDNIDKTSKKIANFLKIEWGNILNSQTRFGKDQNPFSSFKDLKSGKIVNTHEDRLNKFMQITSRLERKILYLYTSNVAQEFGYTFKHSNLNFLECFMPMRYEPIWKYISNRFSLFKSLREVKIKDSVVFRALQMSQDGNPIDY